MDRDPGPTRIILRYEDGSSFRGVSPFKIAEELRAKIGEVEAAKPVKCGGLLITAYDPDQGSRILQLRSFLEDRVTAEPAERQETCEGLAYASSLTGVPDDELIVELHSQGVVGVRRLRRRTASPIQASA